MGLLNGLIATLVTNIYLTVHVNAIPSHFISSKLRSDDYIDISPVPFDCACVCRCECQFDTQVIKTNNAMIFA